MMTMVTMVIMTPTMPVTMPMMMTTTSATTTTPAT